MFYFSHLGQNINPKKTGGRKKTFKTKKTLNPFLEKLSSVAQKKTLDIFIEKL